ncbi:MAG: hypothetical protein E6Q75_09070 [Rheinheimera sp.]|nr:MAG: hypothetical protein E6Q75_09070 [Rheinheimera sp.]
MKTRNVLCCSLLSIAIFQALAADIPAPLFTSVLSAEDSQIQSRDPLRLTEQTVVKQSFETMRNKIFVRDSHVVMVAELGVTVLERTAQGLVRRHVLEFNADQLRGAGQMFASKDGKKIVWFYGSNTVELDIATDFTASVNIKASGTNYYELFASENPAEFIGYDGNNNQYKLMQVAADGLKVLAVLPATDEIRGSAILYNSKEQVLISARGSWSGQNVIVFKSQNGVFTETNRQLLNITDPWYFRGFIYDIDNARLVLHSPYNRTIEAQIDAGSGVIGAVSDTQRNIFISNAYREFNAVISGEVTVATSSQQEFILQREGLNFREMDLTGDYYSEHNYALHIAATGKTEVWQNTRWSLKHLEPAGGVTLVKQSRGSKERGLPQINGDTGYSSDDQRFWIYEDNGFAVVIGMDTDNKPVVLLELSRTDASNPAVPHGLQFVRVSAGKYLLAGYDHYRVLTEDAKGQLSISAAQTWPQPLYNIYDTALKVKDGLIYMSRAGLHLLQLKNDAVTVVSTLKDKQLTNDELSNITSVVELKGELYALMPRLGKTALLKQQDGQLSVVKTGTMPQVQGPLSEGRDRLFTQNTPLLVLMPDTAGNLQVNAASYQNPAAYLYKQRVKIAQHINRYEPFVLLNDDVTGVWQSQQASGDCCTENTRTRILSGQLLTFINDYRQTMKIYGINTAPYMPARAGLIKLNQGVEADIAVQSYLRDDEQANLVFSGLSNDAFSLTDASKLKYKGQATGSGDLLLTVSDGALQSELKLPYQINAAPASVRPVPVIVANQHAPLQFDFNDYIEDPEGSAISFAPQNQQGFVLSKSGMLSGTATALTDVTLPLQVTDKAGAVLKTSVTVKVNAAPALTGSSSASAKVNQSFALDLNTVITDTEKHRITLSAQGLPSGLSLNGAVISGTPTAAGTFTVNVAAIDELGARSQLSLSLQIAAEDKKGGGAFGFGLLALLAFVRRRRS